MLLPSIWEGLPIVLLEALSVGCIPICSPVGGVVNVIKDGFNGILSHNTEANAIEESIRRFLSLNKKEIGLMHSNCLASFQLYNIEQTANAYLAAYLS